MATVSTNEFKGGLKLMLDNEPCVILENEYVKPGKGQAFNRVKVRNLKTGRVVEKTWKSGDSVEAADVVDVSKNWFTGKYSPNGSATAHKIASGIAATAVGAGIIANDRSKSSSTQTPPESSSTTTPTGSFSGGFSISSSAICIQLIFYKINF